MTLTQWLQNLGLEQYAPYFAENDIEFDILSTLTDDDLKEIGVTSLGHRKKLLNAIRLLSTEGKPAEAIRPETGSREWSRALSEDDARWFLPAMQSCPSIIAAEYGRLRGLLRQGQTYGAWLQIKDMFEIIIKFPLLVGAACLYHRKERSSAANKILLNLMEKALSLGDWKRIGDTMLKNELQLIPALIPIQRDVAAIFGKRRIVQWRNENIGHGALGFDTGKKFRQDFEEKLAILEAHFAANAKPYGSVQLVGMDEDGGTAPLVGIEGGKEGDALNGGSPGLQTNHGAVHPLTPYFVLQMKGLFFYDSFYRSKKLCAVLNYTSGIKHTQDVAEVRQLYDVLVKESDMEKADTDDTVTGSHYRAEFDKILDKLADIDDFQKPKFLETWLNGALNEHDRGVFMLRMERGTGKTTFARSLDEMQMHKVKLDGFTVRGYYINDSYLHKPEIFRSKLVHSHLNVNRDGRIFLQGDIPILSDSAEDRRQNMAEVLNFFRREFAYHHGNERLLVILDGLDEIPAGDGTTIFDFIPDSSMLDEGVYLLLTCRTEGELSDFTRSRLKTVALDADVSFFRQEQANIALMTAYIRSWDQKKPDEATIALILEKAENRFVYLKTIRELLRVADPTNLDELPRGEALVRYFLDYLKDAYGEKYFNSVARLLAIISTAFEPLTIGEISYLFGEDALTFRMLAYMTDIKGFLKAERSYEGNLFSISQEEYERLFKDYFADLIEVVVQEWVKGLVAKKEGDLDAGNSGELYLAAYLKSYCDGYLPGVLNEVLDEGLIDELRKTGSLYSSYTSTKRMIQRVTLLWGMLIIFYEILEKNGYIFNVNNLSEVHMKRGNAFRKQQKLEEAFSDYTTAIDNQELLKRKGAHADDKILADGYHCRGLISRDYNKIGRSISDLNQAVSILENMITYSKQLKNADLAMAYTSRGISFTMMNDLERSISDYNQAIEIYDQLKSNNYSINENHIARVYMARGYYFMKNNKYKESLSDFDKTIEIREMLHSQSELTYSVDLAMAYMSRGLVLHEMQKYAESYENYNIAIEIQENEKNRNKLFHDNFLAKTYNKRGIAFMGIKKLEKASKDFENAIVIYERLKSQKKFHDENELANSYYGLVRVYSLKNCIEKSLQCCELCLKEGNDSLDPEEFANEEDLTNLRKDPRYHELIAKYFEP